MLCFVVLILSLFSFVLLVVFSIMWYGMIRWVFVEICRLFELILWRCRFFSFLISILGLIMILLLIMQVFFGYRILDGIRWNLNFLLL